MDRGGFVVLYSSYSYTEATKLELYDERMSLARFCEERSCLWYSVLEDKVTAYSFLRLHPYFLHRTQWKNVVVDSISTIVAVSAVNGRSGVSYGLFMLHRLLCRAASTSSQLECSKNAKNVAMLKLPSCAHSSDLVTRNVNILFCYRRVE